MRRKASAVPLGLWSIVVLGGTVACRPPAETPRAAPPETVRRAAPSVDLTKTDVFSGCEHGASHVKILVHLRPTNAGTCRPEVTPASVCVAPGGKVDFKVKNDCENPLAPRLTEPKLKRKADGSLPENGASLPACAADLKTIEVGQAGTHNCDVASNATEGYYKYDVYGEGIERLDPDIEIRN